MGLVRASVLLDRLNQRLTVFIGGLALLIGAAGILVPLYSDEVAMQMTRSRFFVEGGRLLNLLPQCRELASPVPMSWLPGAAINALLYGGAGELGLRLRGLALGSIWVLILWRWAGRHPQQWMSPRTFQGLTLSLNLLGVLPFALILARSEQLMVIALAAYCLWALHAAVSTNEGIIFKLLKLGLFVLVSSVFLLAHPKALFFAPLAFASAVLVFRQGGKLWLGAAITILGGMVFQTFLQAQSIGQCTNAPAVSKMLMQQTLDFGLLRTDIPAFVASAWHNLVSAPSLVFDRIPATLNYQSNWLPGIGDEALAPLLDGFGRVLKFSLLLSTALLVCAVFVRAIREWRNGVVEAQIVLSGALAASLVIHACTYTPTIWHFYTPALILPALILLLMLMADRPSRSTDAGRMVAQLLTSYGLLLALVSASILLLTVVPRLIAAAKADDYVLNGQFLSTPVFLSDDHRIRLEALARRCGIHDGDPRLVVDGSGYFAFQHGRQPIHMLYVSSVAFGADIGNQLPAFLKKIDSSGIVSRCDYLPPGLANKATVDGSMCCLSKSQLQQE